MRSLWFVVPAHGRLELARICLGQLRRTCDLLEAEGIRASAVVVADDENLDTACALGFATVERDNRFTARKFNDGIQLACDPTHNRHPVDYVVPCGSDDWVDHRLFLDLPGERTMVGFPRVAFVREDGREVSVLDIPTRGGSGIRIWPRPLFEEFGWRPADEDRSRACDTSILSNVFLGGVGLEVEHRHLHDFQIVDWKSPSGQLNAYDTLGGYRGHVLPDPFAVLAEFYPAEPLADMQALYAGRMVAA